MQLAADIAASLNASVGRNANGSITWVPPVAALDTIPFNSMAESVYSSYANFRYFAEMLNAGILPDAVAVALMEFREVRMRVAGSTPMLKSLCASGLPVACWNSLWHDALRGAP